MSTDPFASTGLSTKSVSITSTGTSSGGIAVSPTSTLPGTTLAATTEDINKVLYTPTQTSTVSAAVSMNYIADISLDLYMRKIPIDFTSYNLRPNRKVFTFFDSVETTRIVQKPNVFEVVGDVSFLSLVPQTSNNISFLTNVNDGNITGQIVSSRESVYLCAGSVTLNASARILHTESTGNGTTLVYVSEFKNLDYRASISNSAAQGVYSSTTRSLASSETPSQFFGLINSRGQTGVLKIRGKNSNTTSIVINYEHNSGELRYSPVYYGTSFSANSNGVSDMTFSTPHILGAAPSVFTYGLRLAQDASDVENYYAGRTITIVNGDVPGETSNIISYNATTKDIVVSPALTGTKFGARAEPIIYSIGDKRIPYVNDWTNPALYTSPSGFTSGILHIPGNSLGSASVGFNFKVGTKPFTITDSTINNMESATTMANYQFVVNGLDITKQQLSMSFETTNIYANTSNIYYSNTTNVVSSTTYTLPISNFANDALTSGNTSPPTSNTVTIAVTPAKTTTTVTKKDPIAQSFYIAEKEYPHGIFVPYIDLFFKNKGKLPVELQIKPLINGYPSDIAPLPGAISMVESKDVKVSEFPDVNDSKTRTRFTFPAPVYLVPEQEYAIVVLTNDYDYDIYLSELGEKIVGSDRIVSEQPYLGTLFRSQSGSTYTALQSEDLMFVLHKCRFNSTGQLYFNENKNDVTPDKTLLNFSNASVDLFTIHSDAIEIPGTSMKYRYKGTKESTGLIDSQYTEIVPEHQVGLDDRKIIFGPDNKYKSFNMRVDLKTTSPDVSPIVYVEKQAIATAATLINNLGLDSRSIKIADGGQRYTPNTSVRIRSSVGSGANAITLVSLDEYSNGSIGTLYFDSFGSGYASNVEIDITSVNGDYANVVVMTETGKSGGPGAARYISKVVNLAPEFDAGDLRVYLTAIKPPEAEIYVYYKVRNRFDHQSIDERNWVLMEKKIGAVNDSFSLNPIEIEYRPSMTSNNIIYSSESTTFDSFNQFKIKIILASTGTTPKKIPYVLDMRAIALPADTR